MNVSERAEARHALKQYMRLKYRQAEPKITPDYGGVFVQHSASRTTENVALASPLTDAEENMIAAVEFALTMQSNSFNADARLKMVSLCYFARKRVSLDRAAEAVGYSLETIRRWNLELLTAVYVALRRR